MSGGKCQLSGVSPLLHIIYLASVSENVETALQKELDDQKLRYKPESLHLLTEQTHFSEKELKYLYQCFKQVGTLDVYFLLEFEELPKRLRFPSAICSDI